MYVGTSHNEMKNQTYISWCFRIIAVIKFRRQAISKLVFLQWVKRDDLPWLGCHICGCHACASTFWGWAPNWLLLLPHRSADETSDCFVTTIGEQKQFVSSLDIASKACVTLILRLHHIQDTRWADSIWMSVKLSVPKISKTQFNDN